MISVFRAPEIKNFNSADYETKQVFYESKDGTRIPMFIVHRKGLKLDGNNPALLYGYGGFNSTTNALETTANIYSLIFYNLGITPKY